MPPQRKQRKRRKVAPKRKPPGKARSLKVVDAVKRDLALIAKRDKALAESSLAASALVLARALDNPRNSATSKSMCSRSLIETMDRLLELAPPAEEKDKLDELSSRRAARRERKTAAAN